MKNLYILESNLGYYFNNKNLLILSLTHSSSCKNHNERLEFLGDSVLNYCTSNYLYNTYPNFQEGEMSIMRAYLVSRKTLYKISHNLDLKYYINFGHGEIKNGGYRDYIYANVLESVIGAIVIDSNIFIVGKLLILWFTKYLNKIKYNKNYKDYKTILQEYLQKSKLDLPCYKIVKVTGKIHKPKFLIQCQIKHYPNIIILGSGYSKKNAEQESAKQALNKLGILID